MCFIVGIAVIGKWFNVGDQLTTYTLTVAFAALGVMFLGVGYTMRPKKPTTITPFETKPEETISEISQPSNIVSETPQTVEITPSAPQSTLKAEEPRIELTNVKGIGPKRAEQLKRLGIYTVYDLADANADELAKKVELSPKITNRWVEEAKKLIAKK
jgi:predicted flap endonuclease-1-like 5' DNA nuclease